MILGVLNGSETSITQSTKVNAESMKIRSRDLNGDNHKLEWDKNWRKYLS